MHRGGVPTEGPGGAAVAPSGPGPGAHPCAASEYTL